MQLAQQDLSMACTGQFAWHLGEEAEPRGEGAEPRGEGAWPWELGAEGQRLSPGFGQLWVVIALCNPGLSLDVMSAEQESSGRQQPPSLCRSGGDA